MYERDRWRSVSVVKNVKNA